MPGRCWHPSRLQPLSCESKQHMDLRVSAEDVKCSTQLTIVLPGDVGSDVVDGPRAGEVPEEVHQPVAGSGGGGCRSRCGCIDVHGGRHEVHVVAQEQPALHEATCEEHRRTQGSSVARSVDCVDLMIMIHRCEIPRSTCSSVG